MYAILVDVRLHTKELLLSFILSHRERDRYSDFQKRKWNLFKKKRKREKRIASIFLCPSIHFWRGQLGAKFEGEEGMGWKSNFGEYRRRTRRVKEGKKREEEGSCAANVHG